MRAGIKFFLGVLMMCGLFQGMILEMKSESYNQHTNIYDLCEKLLIINLYSKLHVLQIEKLKIIKVTSV